MIGRSGTSSAIAQTVLFVLLGGLAALGVGCVSPAGVEQASPVEPPVSVATATATEESPPTGETIVEPAAPEVDVYDAISVAVASGDTSEAIRLFEAAFSAYPTSAEDMRLYAALLMGAGEILRAKELLHRVLDADGGDLETLHDLASIEAMMGNTEQRVALLERIIELEPDDPRAHASLGEIHLAGERLAEAERSFELSLAADPANLLALLGSGNVLLLRGESEAAERQFDKAIEEAPEYAFAYIDRSRARSRRDDHTGAEADLTTAIALDPEYYWNYVDRGRLRLLGLADRGKALEDFDRAIAMDPDFFYPYIFRAGILDQKGEWSRAIEDYLVVLEARHDYYYVYAPLATLLYMSERWKESRKYFRLAWDFDEQQYGYPLMVALAYKKEGRDDLAEKYLLDAVAKMPRDSLFYQVGRLFTDSGYDAQVVSLASKEPDGFLKLQALFYIASFYQLMGRDSIAHIYFLEVVDGGPRDMFERRIASWELEKYQ